MKRLAALVLAACFAVCAAGALAEGCIGPAATTAEAALLDTPQEDGIVLMRYYIGVRVEVVREVDTRYVQVNVGEPGGSLMGYMKKESLAFGEEAIRRVHAEYVQKNTNEQTCTLYSYMDTGSPVVLADCCIDYDTWVTGWLGDEWLHVRLRSLGEWKTGFVCLGELENVSESRNWPGYIYVEPLEGEFTDEEAIAYAFDVILNSRDSTPTGEQVDEQVLRQCTPQVDRVMYNISSPERIRYEISFWHDEEYIYMDLWFVAEGKEIIEDGFGVG